MCVQGAGPAAAFSPAACFLEGRSHLRSPRETSLRAHPKGVTLAVSLRVCTQWVFNAGVNGCPAEKGHASTKGGGQLVLPAGEKEVGPCLTPHRG